MDQLTKVGRPVRGRLRSTITTSGIAFLTKLTLQLGRNLARIAVFRAVSNVGPLGHSLLTKSFDLNFFVSPRDNACRTQWRYQRRRNIGVRDNKQSLERGAIFDALHAKCAIRGGAESTPGSSKFPDSARDCRRIFLTERRVMDVFNRRKNGRYFSDSQRTGGVWENHFYIDSPLAQPFNIRFKVNFAHVNVHVDPILAVP